MLQRVKGLQTSPGLRLYYLLSHRRAHVADRVAVVVSTLVALKRWAQACYLVLFQLVLLADHWCLRIEVALELKRVLALEFAVEIR